MAEHHHLLYDDACGLCCRSIRFVHRHDARDRFRFVPLGSARARSMLHAHGLPPDTRDTVVLIHDGRVDTHSDAALATLARLEKPWSFLSALRIVPRPVRDVAYRLIARNRHRLYHDRACAMADPTLRARILE